LNQSKIQISDDSTRNHLALGWIGRRSGRVDLTGRDGIMRPAAFFVLNIFGLLVIGGLLEAPRSAASILILIGFALPAGLAYEVGRDRLDRAIAVAAAWWSAPFVVLLTCYLIQGGMLMTLGSGLFSAGLIHLARAWLIRGRAADPDCDEEPGPDSAPQPNL